MLLAIGLGILFTNILLMTGGIYVYKKTTSLAAEVGQAFEDYFKPSGEDQLSDFSRTVDSIAYVFADKMRVSTVAAVKGSLGGSQKAINAALEQEAIEEDPSLAMTQVLPKSLRKNPLAMMGFKAIMNKMVQGAGNISPGSRSGSPGNGHGQVKFNL